jgi:putative endonuclease
VLARNYQSPAGEIDLIFRFGPALVFVEVKTRSAFGPKDRRQAAELVQWSRIDHAARYFVARYRIQPCPMRFDLVTVEWTDAARRPCIEHVPGAYTSPLQWA